jgi:glycosyltransferase involved in cell wall biosynthesis
MPQVCPGTEPNPRPTIQGKFIYAGGKKIYIKGVTYGTFRPDENGNDHYDPAVVAADFAQMRDAGINAIRVYSVPPVWFLNAALEFGLYVMVGLAWEQHVAFLDIRNRQNEIVKRVRNAVKSCGGHPAILCFTIGNEIPSNIVRWLGPKRVTQFLKRLYWAVKQEDPQALVTYVNFPSTEYLDLSFVDFFCFNVYLESEERLESYLARLQNLAGDRPLVMAEIGLDSRRNGLEVQADTLTWQVRIAFAEGCAGAFIFAWTDEWWRGGHDIEDWDFGLVTRDRSPKPALQALTNAFAAVPFPHDTAWPSISVVICSYNGARTIRDCMEGLQEITYPNFEVIVVDDGSTDSTAQIVAEYDVKLIRTANQGLSSARNTGLMAATGEIVAYTDDDARPDPDWLHYLAHSFMRGAFAGVGGPNIPPPNDGWIADCVANSPGGPVHVLLCDRVAEHIPGCNMAFRRDVLLDVGGCDPMYRVAGDDVDLCWRVQQNGGTLGFSPAAMVWHHRRNSVRLYWRQQQGYGKAEALLESKWPEKYNHAGHLTWQGRLYGKGLTDRLFFSRRVYHGEWGTALFQSVYERARGNLSCLPLMPEWYLLIGLLGTLSVLAFFWKPLLGVVPSLLAAILTLVWQAIRSANKAQFTSPQNTFFKRFRLRFLTALFHVLQPLARLRGRIRWGLTPWRMDISNGTVPLPRKMTTWSERWKSPEEWLQHVETLVLKTGTRVIRGGDFDKWDITVRGGLLGSARLLSVVEEHGSGKQLIRWRIWPVLSYAAVLPMLLFATVALFAAWDGGLVASVVLFAMALSFIVRSLLECGKATAFLIRATNRCKDPEQAAQASTAKPVFVLSETEKSPAYTAGGD